MSTTQHHKQQWQLLKEPSSSKDSFGQTCLCLSNHTRSLQTQIINFVPLFSLQTCSHSERKTSSQGQVGTFTEWALTPWVLVARIPAFVFVHQLLTCMVCGGSWPLQELTTNHPTSQGCCQPTGTSSPYSQ